MKRGWKYGAGASLLKKRVGAGGTCTFPKGLSFLHLEITLPFEEKKFFFCHHHFMKKGHCKLSKYEPENIP